MKKGEFIKERFYGKKTLFRPRKKKTRKHANDQEKKQDSRKNERKHANDQKIVRKANFFFYKFPPKKDLRGRPCEEQMKRRRHNE